VKLKESFIVKKFGPNARLDVRFRGQTGKCLLVLSFSGFEPSGFAPTPASAGAYRLARQYGSEDLVG
jgi:hypothetical protein